MKKYTSNADHDAALEDQELENEFNSFHLDGASRKKIISFSRDKYGFFLYLILMQAPSIPFLLSKFIFNLFLPSLLQTIVFK